MSELGLLCNPTSLGSQGDDSARQAPSSVSRSEGILVTTLAQIVHHSVHDNRTTHDGVGAAEWDLVVHNVDHGHAMCIGSDIAKVAGMANFVGRRTVGAASRVEVGAARGAAVGGVPELVNVETMLALLEARNLAWGERRWLEDYPREELAHLAREWIRPPAG